MSACLVCLLYCWFMMTRSTRRVWTSGAAAPLWAWRPKMASHDWRWMFFLDNKTKQESLWGDTHSQSWSERMGHVKNSWHQRDFICRKYSMFFSFCCLFLPFLPVDAVSCSQQPLSANHWSSTSMAVIPVKRHNPGPRPFCSIDSANHSSFSLWQGQFVCQEVW